MPFGVRNTVTPVTVVYALVTLLRLLRIFLVVKKLLLYLPQNVYTKIVWL